MDITMSDPTKIQKLSPINLDVNYPIPPHPTWDVWDSTKLVEAMRCMRRVFFHYLLGWQTEHENHDLIFGQAWHVAMDYMYEHGMSVENIPGAMMAFNAIYREHFDEYTDLDYEPKIPTHAEYALKSYVRFRHADEWKVMTITEEDGTIKLLIEVSGSVPVSDRWRLTYRIDKVMSNQAGHVIGRDHKSAKRDTEVERLSWAGRMQPNLYSHALSCLVDESRFRGIEMDICFFRKKDVHDDGVNRHMTIPVYRDAELRKGWLVDCLSHLNRIENSFNQLEHTNIDDPVMAAFSRDETGCTAFYRMCPYYQVCHSHNNPLKVAGEPPLGFIAKWWNPLETTKEHPTTYHFEI